MGANQELQSLISIEIKQVCYSTEPLSDESANISRIVPAQLLRTQMS